MQDSTSFLNRFTTLPNLLDLLSSKCLTLVPPASWEDRNDRYYLDRYKDAKNLKTVLAICLTARGETFHMWKVFANGPAGVCIEFDRKDLLASVEQVSGTRTRLVDYSLIKENVEPALAIWPFLKRKVFLDEKEFRIVYENVEKDEETKAIPIKLGSIRRITISPWLKPSVFDSVKRVIRSIPGCDKLKISHSTLLETKRWQDCLPMPQSPYNRPIASAQ